MILLPAPAPVLRLALLPVRVFRRSPEPTCLPARRSALPPVVLPAQNRYYQGTPASYQPGTGTAYCSNPSVAGTALKAGVAGAAVGAGAGALIGGISVLEGAAIGAAVGGLGGAVWADSNNDGCVDGYVRENGQYYAGVPAQQSTPVAYTGERG